MRTSLIAGLLPAALFACSSAPPPSAAPPVSEPIAPREAPAEPALAAPSPGTASSATAQPTPQAPPIPPGTAVLHIGDSFALAGFAQGLKPHMKSVKARYEVRSEQSSYTNGWAAKVEQIVADTQPDLVIINLGANEIESPNPGARAKSVRRIVAVIGARPCVWVSPPLWKKDTGILDVIRENAAPCRYFDTDETIKAPIARQKDGIHPNEEGGKVWADAFWNWLEAQRALATAQSNGSRSPWALAVASPDEYRARGSEALPALPPISSAP